MGEAGQRALRWEVATDPEEAHALLLESDAEQAERYGLPAPRRNPATTARRVRAGQVHVVRRDDRAVGSFTLTAEPPFALEPGVFPETTDPLYLSRLCVASPELRTGSLVGLRCLREAIAVAIRAGATALRSQANPDFGEVFEMLRAHGFQPCGGVAAHGPLRFVNLQKDLAAPRIASS